MASATVSTRASYVERFTLTERLLHWIHASAFFVLLASGLVLYLPTLSAHIARRPLIKDIHFWTGISWAGAILLVVALGNRRRSRRPRARSTSSIATIAASWPERRAARRGASTQARK